MNDLRTAAQQALEFVTSERWGTTPYMDVCVYEDAARLREALRAALAQQAEPVEPVAWECREHGDSEWFACGKESYGINPRRYTYRTLYTAPPPPQRKTLTEEEMYAVEEEARRCHWQSQRGVVGQQITYWDGLTPWLIRAVERAVWEKNYG